MTLQVDLFWSFRSPYSYLGMERFKQLERDWNLTVNVRPVYPIAIRTPEFFSQVNLMWPAYLMKDVFRVAEHLGVPFQWPDPDPVVMDMKTRTIPKEQPYIHRLTRLGIEAVNRGRGLAFLDEISRTIWGKAVKNWHQGDHLKDATARAGLDLAAMEQSIEGNEQAYEDAIKVNEDALEKCGHWGVPTLAFKGEPFFGQDRIDMCLWRMKQAGLEPRT
ncbi:MAG: 2-hydroxychromene-2-carboxylate isomerase [Minwuia sp.]|uniref:2-hydroxychromene-2-carboxylate isomerase n=1 Tax=Minwuia sp. TaxID=2493630 RepID=UPI003A8AF6B4